MTYNKFKKANIISKQCNKKKCVFKEKEKLVILMKHSVLMIPIQKQFI